jgi:hypothetical protein
LISIHSAEENKFVIDLVDSERTSNISVWIGAKRNNSLGYFEWTNGKEFNYSNWRSGEPENSTAPESQVVIYTGGTWGTWGIWATWVENIKALFICENDSSDE